MFALHCCRVTQQGKAASGSGSTIPTIPRHRCRLPAALLHTMGCARLRLRLPFSPHARMHPPPPHQRPAPSRLPFSRLCRPFCVSLAPPHLNAAARGRVVSCYCEFQRGVVGQRQHLLHQSLTERFLPHHNPAVHILHATREPCHAVAGGVSCRKPRTSTQTPQPRAHANVQHLVSLRRLAGHQAWCLAEQAMSGGAR